MSDVASAAALPEVKADAVQAECKHRSSGLNHIEYFELVRAQVHHEDDLINDRLSWLMQSQTIFLAAYVALATAKPEYEALRIAIVVVGLALIVLPGFGINAAIHMMRDCADDFAENCPFLNQPEKGALWLPGLAMSDRLYEKLQAGDVRQRLQRIARRGMVPALWIPWVFAGIWLVSLVSTEYVVWHAQKNPRSRLVFSCDRIGSGEGNRESILTCRSK